LRVNAQLIDARTGTHLWARTYDRRLADVFVLQAELTDQIGASLVSYVRQSETDLANGRSPEDLRAYDLVLRARELSANKTTTPQDFAEARRLLLRALELDPSYASAHAHLALSLIADQVLGITGTATDADLTAGMEAARRAISLEPDLAIGYRALGFGLSATGASADALQAAQRAVELNPSDPDNLTALAKAQLRAGAYADAAENAARARRLHPMAPNYFAFVQAQALYAADRFDEASAALSDCLIRPEERGNCLRIMTAVNVRQGRLDDARRRMSELMQAEPDFDLSRERQTLRYGETSMMERYMSDLAKALPVASQESSRVPS
jgi:adenylate cyclase